MTSAPYDIVVIGGGINGAGIAADAAGRGLRVLLAETGDLGGATSSASSKLIHGGLRYLEQYAFRLVHEALGEREVLLAKAAHIVWPLKFVLPHMPGMRPAPMLRAGLFLYDHLSPRRSLQASRAVNLTTDPAGAPLADGFQRGFSYWDCWVDDARLVIANAMAARDRGAVILPRTEVTALSVRDGLWYVDLGSGSARRTVVSKTIVNAGGPWVAQIARMALGSRNTPPPAIRLVKGSHIVVPRITGANDAYIFQNTDGRVVFALPYEGAFTLIGTTDTPFSDDPRTVAVTVDDEAYLLALANRYFRAKLTAREIVWRFAGVRPLDDDGSDNPSAVSRDYHLQLDADAPPILHIIGGKITTYRKLAEAALEHLTPYLKIGPAWTANSPLPGGDVGTDGYDVWFGDLVRRRPGLARTTLDRLARRYGTRTDKLLDSASHEAELGIQLGGGLSACEVAFLKADEWAMTADDVIWRRTKTALHVPPDSRTGLAEAVRACLDRG